MDSFSTDTTIAIASQYEHVRVLQREFKNFSDQKNFAIAQAKNDWVVFFDPDEEITSTISEEIKKTLQNPEAIAYSIKRELYFMGKRMQYSGFQTDWVIRLFHKDHCQYDGSLVHETINANGAVIKMKSRLPHHTYKDFDDYVKKLDHYSSLQAEKSFKKGKKATLWHFMVRPWYRFWHQYIIRLGILDGKEGFILAYVNANSVFKRYVKLHLMYKNLK